MVQSPAVTLSLNPNRLAYFVKLAVIHRKIRKSRGSGATGDTTAKIDLIFAEIF